MKPLAQREETLPRLHVCVFGMNSLGYLPDGPRTADSHTSGSTTLSLLSWLISILPVAERSMALVCRRLPAGIAGSNPADVNDVCLF